MIFYENIYIAHVESIDEENDIAFGFWRVWRAFSYQHPIHPMWKTYDKWKLDNYNLVCPD